MVMRIAHQQIAVAINAQSAWPAISVVRRRPAALEVIPVTIEDLNTRRVVDDVDAVPGIDGHSPRLDELAALCAMPAVDHFWLLHRPSATTGD